VTLEYSGKNLTAPDLQDHAVLILAHGVKHTWCLLHWVLDAAVLLSRSEEGFQEAFMARVCGLGLQRQLKLTCDVVRTLYPINLTPAIETLMQNEPRLEYSKSFALDRLQTRNRDQDSIKNTILFTIGYSLPLAGTVMGKIRCILYPLKIWQEDFKAIPLPPYLYFLHFLFRPFFVVSRRLKKRRRNGGSLHG